VVQNITKLTFFEKWFDPVAEEILQKCDYIELVRLTYATSDAENWKSFAVTHGYQMDSSSSARDPWFARKPFIAKAPQLLAICTAGAGFDLVDVDACTEAGIIVCNQSGANIEAVAEHTVGMMLSLSKRVIQSDRAMRSRTINRMSYVGNDIKGKTLGIVGIGNIGTRVAKLCGTLFDMQVLAYDPYLTVDQIKSRGAQKVTLEELLGRSDFVTVHCPLTSETRYMIGAPQFALMKPSAYFIITARGGIYDETALYQALIQNKIAGAGIDVFEKEPPPLDHPLLTLDNAFVSPHIAGITHEALFEMARSAAEQWKSIFAGEVPPRLLNPKSWPLYQERFHKILGFRPPALGPSEEG